MNFAIIRESIEIRLRFENPPKITADTECAVTLGMLAGRYGLALPQRGERLETMIAALKEQIDGRPADEQQEKLADILFRYEPKEPLGDEGYQLVVYGYEHCGTAI